jgi:hypothetical protein
MLMPDESGIVFFDSASGETIFTSDSSIKNISVVNNCIDWEVTEESAANDASLDTFLSHMEKSGILIRA